MEAPDLNKTRITKLVFFRDDTGAKIKRVYADGHDDLLPQTTVRHSPTGFEWGYGGSGPADLALNILALFMGPNEAFTLHQEFKAEKIATMPLEGGDMTATEICDWITAHGGRPITW